MSAQQTVITSQNPAQKEQAAVANRRIPMGVPRQRLNVAPITGFYLYWFLDEDDILSRAIDAGYTFVTKGETRFSSPSVVTTNGVTPSSELGDRVTAASKSSSGAKLYLMKLPQQFHEEDRKERDEASARMAQTLKQGRAGGAVPENAYIPEVANLNANFLTSKGA